MEIRRLKAVGTLWLALVMVVTMAPAASAACHRFDLDVSDSSPDEGDTVTVTVSRDAAVNDSSVRVTAAAGSAQPGSDFSALNEQVNFTGSTTERSFQINVIGDSAAEPSETFTVRLSDPGGCAINPNFQLADPQTVTIGASQGAAAPPPPPPPAPAPAPAPPPAPAPAPAPAPVQTTAAPDPTDEASPEPTESPTIETTPLDDTDDDGGGIPLPLAIGVLALVAAAGIAVWLVRQRRAAPPV